MSLPNEIQGFGTPDEKPKRKGSGLGCFIIVSIIMGAVALCIGVIFVTFQQAAAVIPSLPDFSTMISSAIGDLSQPIPGDASHFDPVAMLPKVHDYAGDGAQLVSIEAHYVRSDGTMELTADYDPAPSIDYKFQSKLDQPPDNAPPVGAGGANTGDWYQIITVSLSRPGALVHVFSGSTTYSYTNLGMERDMDSPTNDDPQTIIADPACSFADLWKIAVKRDAPANAVATIIYDENGYRFSIEGLTVNLTFDSNCQLTSK